MRDCLLIYDADCMLCSGWARFIARRRAAAAFELIPMQGDRGRALLLANGIDPADPETFLVLDHGRALTDSAAAIWVLTRLGGAWKLASVLLLVPQRWRDLLYRFLARNRYRFGKRNLCRLH